MSQFPESSSPSHLRTGDGSTIGFDLQPLPDGLEPPTSIEPAVAGILLYLDKYLWVLHNNGSISFNRGESPFSTQLCEQLGRFFMNPKPNVIEGPIISWVRVVLSAGPSPGCLNQTASLRVGESTIQLSEGDCELLASGRPWRFLNPWPDERDLKRELALVNEDMDGLDRVKTMLHKAIESTNEVERQLSFRRSLLSEPRREQTRPSTSESQRHSSDITAFEFTSTKTTETSMRTDYIEDAMHQKCNAESATGRSDLQPHEFRSILINDRAGHSTSIVETGYINVAQLSTCEVSDSEERVLTSQATERPVQSASQAKLTLPPTTISPFIQELVDALEDPGNSKQIGWSDDGSSFIIQNWKEFEKKVLPSIYPNKTYQNFTCLLRRYGFILKQPSPKTSWSNTDAREYFNRHFQRGDKDSLLLIQKKSHEPRTQTEDSSTPPPSASTRATSLDVGSNGEGIVHNDIRAQGSGPRVKFFRKRRADSPAVGKRRKI